MQKENNRPRQLDYKRLTKDSFGLIMKSLSVEMTVSEFEKSLKSLLKNEYYAQKNEYYAIYDAVLSTYKKSKRQLKSGKWKDILAYNTTFNSVYYATKRANESNKAMIKLDNLQRAFDRGFIFFMCDSHPNCADDHKDYQGKIYVDKNWRSRVPPELYLPVLSYIELRHIRTVQSVLGKPVWLTTRPYCKHKLSPVPTATVLNSPQNLLLQTYGKSKPFPIVSEQDYYAFRRQVYTMLNDLSPCKQFLRKSRTK